jgi:hypothetical protein
MGQELECRMRLGKRTLQGKAHLETDHLLFRGDERVKVALKDLRGVEAADGVLKLDFPGGPAELELGKAAARWAAKILQPPSRAEKLGLKPGAKVRLVGEFDGDFREELRGCAVVTRGGELVFYAAADRADLSRVAKLATGIAAGAALWIVYPKGVATIREVEVIAAGRAAGLKDVKVARFSEKLTALKFVR